MLRTSEITRDLKERLKSDRYMYVPYDMKIMLLKEEIINSICDSAGFKNRRGYSLEDAVSILDIKTKIEGDNRNIFASYINAVINIVSELQGSMILWEQTDYTDPKLVNIVRNDCGFIDKIKTNKKSKLSSVLVTTVNYLDQKHNSKLLVK